MINFLVFLFGVLLTLGFTVGILAKVLLIGVLVYLLSK